MLYHPEIQYQDAPASSPIVKERAPRNQTITLLPEEQEILRKTLLHLDAPVKLDILKNRTVHQSIFEALPLLPKSCVDLLFVDPPYNMNKQFNSNTFKKKTDTDYERWIASWLIPMKCLLKNTASLYICCDWRSSGPFFNILSKNFYVRNRITFERDKGRGATANWKNCSEDIWFCTVSENYYFNVDAVKISRKVIAPYKTKEGIPKDWEDTYNGKFRLTHPSNLWTDITIPFWSMPENTDHPTQKPEKLLAKILLASTKPGDFVLDPFLGSGTTSVVAKKLGRTYLGVELDEMYCCLAEKRLSFAERDPAIQGYENGIFFERNTVQQKNHCTVTQNHYHSQQNFF